MRWVKETLPPRERLRWLLMTMRLSDSSLAGTARTEVAVGIDSELSMFFTTRAAAPLSGVRGRALRRGLRGRGLGAAARPWARGFGRGLRQRASRRAPAGWRRPRRRRAAP